MAQAIRDGRERISRAASFEKRMSRASNRNAASRSAAALTGNDLLDGPTDAPVILLKGWLHARLAQSARCLPSPPCGDAAPLWPHASG